MRKNWSLASVR